MDIFISSFLFNKLEIMENKEHIITYKTYLIILFALISLTLISVGLTRIEFNEYTLAVALILASIKSSLVLIYFMHLKFEHNVYKFMMIGVIMLIITVLAITFLDYSYR